MERRKDKETKRQIEIKIEKDGKTERCKDREMDRQRDGKTERQKMERRIDIKIEKRWKGRKKKNAFYNYIFQTCFNIRNLFYIKFRDCTEEIVRSENFAKIFAMKAQIVF